MKECWINVYNNGIIQWQGQCYGEKFIPNGNLTSKVIYRIHVRLK